MLPLKQSVEMLPALNDTSGAPSSDWTHIWTPFEGGNGQKSKKKKGKGRFVLWALFGLFQGLWAIAFYIVLTMYDERKVEDED